MNPAEYAQLFKLGQAHWWFVGTRDIIVSSLRHRSFRDTPILDVGCGSGLMTERLSNFGTVFGADKDDGALTHCRTIGLSRLCRSDAVSLPFKSETFGLIVATDLIEHCEDDRAVLGEFHRVAASGGTLLISVPAYNWLWSKHDVALHHQRRYSKDKLIQKVGAAGFVVDRTSFFNTALFVPIALKRLIFERAGSAQPEQGIKYYENFRLLNQMLLAILRLEKWLLKFGGPPFGLSILLLASKK